MNRKSARFGAFPPLRAMIRSKATAWFDRAKPGILHVLHDRGGGTEKFVLETIEQTRDAYRHYFLRIQNDRWRVTDPLKSPELERDFRWRPAPSDPGKLSHYDFLRTGAAASEPWLSSVCAWLGIDLIHVHSLVGSDGDLLEAITAASIPYCYTAHDMYLPCPTVYLIDSDGKYCNATTDAITCTRCLSAQGMKGIDIEAWRARHSRFLTGARQVWTPSEWARGTLRTYFPCLVVDVAPPDGTPPIQHAPAHSLNGLQLPDDERRSIGMLGAIGPEKGARVIDAMVERIRARALPLRIVVIGYTDREQRFMSDDAVLAVHGHYRVPDITALLDHYRVRLLAFPTIWPETFGYTLSEAWNAARPAMVPPQGALAERVTQSGAGWIIENWPQVDAMLDQCMHLTGPAGAHELDRRARLARSAASALSDGSTHTDRYAGVLRDAPIVRHVDPALRRIYEAASRARESVESRHKLAC